MTIPFNKALITGEELDNLKNAFQRGDIKGSFNSPFVSLCTKWVEKSTKSSRVHLTTSGTAALEFAAMLADIQPGDEVIMPSYAYISTMNAFVLRGARCVFIDIRKDTMNMDETLIEAAITPRTRAIVPIHYSSIACDMKTIMEISAKHNLLVIEDAACCLGSWYNDRPQGSIGHIGCFSFHATKPFTAGGQGGAIMVNSPELFERAEIIYENGTNRRQFGRGKVSSYTVTDIGSNFQMSETAAACLWSQLMIADKVSARRTEIWNMYHEGLRDHEAAGWLDLPNLPDTTTKHNGGQFWILCKSEEQRGQFMKYMKDSKIETQFHFPALHKSPFGKERGIFIGEDKHTTACSERIVRLPLFYDMTDGEVQKVLRRVRQFFDEETTKVACPII